MKIKKTVYMASFLFLLSTTSVMAGEISPSLNPEREQVIRDYILDLEKGDAEAMAALFEEDGTVMSTSRGKVNANQHFHAFLPQIASAQAKLNQMFVNTVDKDRYVARFHFTFSLKDGENGDGEFVDEFIFSHNSNKLKSVYVFENLKFKE